MIVLSRDGFNEVPTWRSVVRAALDLE